MIASFITISMWYTMLLLLSDPKKKISFISGLAYGMVGFLMGFILYSFNILFVFHVFYIESNLFSLYSVFAYVSCGILSYLSARGNLKGLISGS